MAALTAVGLGLTAGSLIASNISAKKQKKAAEKREKAIDRENRKNAIGRALGVTGGTARQLPSGVADTGLIDTLGGLAGVGSGLAFRGASAPPASDVRPFTSPRPAALPASSLNRLLERRGAFPTTTRGIA